MHRIPAHLWRPGDVALNGCRMRAHLAEQELLEGRGDELVRLGQPTCKAPKEEADRFIVELPDEHEFAEHLEDYVVSPNVHSTS